MKKLGKIKLDQLNKAELSEKELNRLLGGENCCLCACAGPSGYYICRGSKNIIEYKRNLIN